MDENPQESKKSTFISKVSKERLIGIIAVLVVVLLIVIIVFGVFIGRSAKSTVKDVAKVVKNTDIVGAIDLIDPAGIAAFVSCYDYRNEEIDFDEFDENYKEIEQGIKKVKKEIKKGKYTIKVTESKKVSDSKKLTKVTCDIKVKYNDNEVELNGMEIYTMKKGLKNYIVGIDPKSIEKAERQLDKQEDAIYDIGEELGEILEDELEDMEDIF